MRKVFSHLLSIAFLFCLSRGSVALQDTSLIIGFWSSNSDSGTGWLFADDGTGAVVLPNQVIPFTYEFLGDNNYRFHGVEQEIVHIDLLNETLLVFHDFETMEPVALIRSGSEVTNLPDLDPLLVPGIWANGYSLVEVTFRAIQITDDGNILDGSGIIGTYAVEEMIELEFEDGVSLTPLYVDAFALVLQRTDEPSASLIAYFRLPERPVSIEAELLTGVWQSAREEWPTLTNFRADGTFISSSLQTMGRYELDDSGRRLSISPDVNADQVSDWNFTVLYIDNTVLRLTGIGRDPGLVMTKFSDEVSADENSIIGGWSLGARMIRFSADGTFTGFYGSPDTGEMGEYQLAGDVVLLNYETFHQMGHIVYQDKLFLVIQVPGVTNDALIYSSIELETREDITR